MDIRDTLTPENARNLRTMCAYLWSGKLIAAFDMGLFSNGVGHECGTVGCVLGHAASVIGRSAREGWIGFSDRAFGLRAFGSSHSANCWAWCFSCAWKGTDNTPHGAASRIEWMLERGLPADWERQMYGKSPLCYQQSSLPVREEATSDSQLAIAK